MSNEIIHSEELHRIEIENNQIARRHRRLRRQAINISEFEAEKYPQKGNENATSK